MCRLLGYVSTSARSVRDVVGADLDGFCRLSRKHGDGWGVAWPDTDKVLVRRSTVPAEDDPEFTAFADDHHTDAALVHLRLATMGLSVRDDNTHPFTEGTIAFAHNGSVWPPQSIDPLIAPELRSRLVGDTDSERYFLAVLDRMRDRHPADALADTVDALDASCAFTSLNSMLLTPEALYVVSKRGAMAAEVADPDYYTLRYRTTADTVIVASSGWSQDGWTELPDGEMLVVERGTLTVSVRPLESLAA